MDITFNKAYEGEANLPALIEHCKSRAATRAMYDEAEDAGDPAPTKKDKPARTDIDAIADPTEDDLHRTRLISGKWKWQGWADYKNTEKEALVDWSLDNEWFSYSSAYDAYEEWVHAGRPNLGPDDDMFYIRYAVKAILQDCFKKAKASKKDIVTQGVERGRVNIDFNVPNRRQNGLAVITPRQQLTARRRQEADTRREVAEQKRIQDEKEKERSERNMSLKYVVDLVKGKRELINRNIYSKTEQRTYQTYSCR